LLPVLLSKSFFENVGTLLAAARKYGGCNSAVLWN
jgi:hypothetical protein